ncbi:MAG: ATP-binding protein [Eubacteriales bacterium]|nr:ATP-binding protein [Eubacteriales bacterium]
MGRDKEPEVKAPSGLTPEQEKNVREVVERARKDRKVPKSAQDTIPLQRMFKDGICRASEGYYTKTIEFKDINYQLAQQEDKTAIFEEWCSFLNYFDSSVRFELSFVNMAADRDEIERSIHIPDRDDDFDSVRSEYKAMLRKQMSQGNNGLIKTKYLTFGIEAESMEKAKPRIMHLETALLNNFRRLGVRARALDGTERLKLMHDIYHMGDREKFTFNWKWLVDTGLSVKDFIAPTSFGFPTGTAFRLGDLWGTMSYLQITASDISDRLLADFLDGESSQVVTMHVRSVNQNEAIKTVKHTITELDRSKIEEQQKAVRSGYDMDIIPSDLATYGKDAKELLRELQNQNERMFMLTFLVLNTGKTKEELEDNFFRAASTAQKHNCVLRRLDYQQEEGLNSSLPLAANEVEVKRAMTTSSTAIFMPFTSQELFQESKEALYCGLNALSSNMILVDRKLLKNPNGIVLGTPGSGKSFAAKREIMNVFLVTDDDIIICDPEAEYEALVRRLNGQVIRISPSSTHYINPMDINDNYSEGDDSPLALKSDFILSLCELVVGGKEGLNPVEKTVIDRCVHRVYQGYFNDPRPENMPVLEDLYDELLRQEEKEARHVATALEIYVKGSLNLFKEIISEMKERYGIETTRNTVCSDIGLMQECGLPVEVTRSGQNEYYWDGQLFEPVELRVLIDAVASSKTMTKRQSDELTEKLLSLTGSYAAEELRKNTYPLEWVKGGNENLFYIMDGLNHAVDEGSTVSFSLRLADDPGKSERITMKPERIYWDGEYYHVRGTREEGMEPEDFRLDLIVGRPKTVSAVKRTRKKRKPAA